MDAHYTMDNTQGYTQEELDVLNQELHAWLKGIEPYTDQWYAISKQHADEVARR